MCAWRRRKTVIIGRHTHGSLLLDDDMPLTCAFDLMDFDMCSNGGGAGAGHWGSTTTVHSDYEPIVVQFDKDIESSVAAIEGQLLFFYNKISFLRWKSFRVSFFFLSVVVPLFFFTFVKEKMALYVFDRPLLSESFLSFSLSFIVCSGGGGLYM